MALMLGTDLCTLGQCKRVYSKRCHANVVAVAAAAVDEL